MASPNFTASGNSRDRELGRSVSQDSSDSTANLLFPTDSSPFYHRNGEFFEDAYESDGNGLQRQRFVIPLNFIFSLFVIWIL